MDVLPPCSGGHQISIGEDATMTRKLVSRLERLETKAPVRQPSEPVTIVFVNPDKTEHSRIVLQPNPLPWQTPVKQSRWD
jgi:hypothetical protein